MEERVDLIVQLVFDAPMLATTRLSLRAVNKASLSAYVPSCRRLDCLYRIRIARNAMRVWKQGHSARYRRPHRTLLGPRRRRRTDDTPILPFAGW